jgi:CheY-like chemotaxis protein
MTRATVLVVDDNPINLKLFQAVLRAEGHDVVTAGDAAAALELLRGCRPDLILMDLQLPGMDGYELTRRLKSAEATCAIPIVAVTSYAMKGDEEKARDCGCDGYVTKPIDTDELARTVAARLARQPGSHRA